MRTIVFYGLDSSLPCQEIRTLFCFSNIGSLLRRDSTVVKALDIIHEFELAK